ncbi:MAG: methylenetetrahydrofolate dehydrogenase [Gammaproteobacteria bacterium]|nr:methylenetetrahydrofolate dehydrogenase [Gammaproteobacteria bacterium]
MGIIDPDLIATRYRAELKEKVSGLNSTPRVIGLIANNDQPSLSYANATKKAFEEIGIEYRLIETPRLSLEKEIKNANNDPGIHGIFIYFPVFGNEEDKYLRNLVDHTKDIEAGSFFWTRKLSKNDRFLFDDKKALIPCTPLAIVKILAEIGAYGSGSMPLKEKNVVIFNRSEVIGRPLAVMMSNDGANVWSFDEFGPLLFREGIPRETSSDRAKALQKSDIVITGVPTSNFIKISPNELTRRPVCINFSATENFTKDIDKHVKTFVPRVGPMTVTMCMRNTIRLYENFL